MDYEEQIIKIFKEAEKNGRKELSTDALSVFLKCPKPTFFKKLKTLEKYKIIKKTKEKKTSFWRIIGEI